MRINLKLKPAVCLLSFLITVSSMAVFRGTDINAATGRANNVNAQDYSEASNTTRSFSYLLKTSDNGYMIFEGNKNETDYLVEYYDASFNLKSSKTVSVELPLFGCFHSDGSYYYVLSGQQNLNQSDDVECYRLTKYDLSWKRISSLAIKACNCYVPFAAGSARIDTSGSSLVIRTCSNRYMLYDGLHHQVNKTFLIDSSKMTLLYSSEDDFDSFGFVSHSFNQFVKFDGDKIIGVDHGDANPRGVVLSSCEPAVKTYDTVPYQAYMYIPLEFFEYKKNNINFTGASIGGFELSDSSYLIAGSSIDQSGKAYSQTRNIFVSTVSRSDDKSVGTKWITNYKGDEKGAGTPLMVKINSNKFALLWSRKSCLYYVFIDGKGNLTGDIKSAAGLLSDCQPIVNNGKIVWYAYCDGNMYFYTIDTSSGQFTSTNDSIPMSAVYIKASNVQYSGGHNSRVGTTVEVSFGGKTLVEGTDYTTSFTSFVEDGFGFADVKGKGKYYGKAETEYWILEKPGWFFDYDYWYYFNDSLEMTKGWKKIGKDWYFFDYDFGTMLTGWVSANGKMYYCNTSGAMATGWKAINGNWYYFGTDGDCAYNWRYIDGAWYYFGDSGVMATGWKMIFGNPDLWYYFKSSGEMVTGWQQLNGKWYYFQSSGAMTTGWKAIGGSWYYFDSEGAMQTGWKQIQGEWYHLENSGAMTRGWCHSGGYWYYLQSDGVMAYSKSLTINGKVYDFDKDGICTNP